MILQRSLDWYRARLGTFSASKMADLMVQGDGEMFGKTAKDYIDKVCAERLLDSSMVEDDFAFETYLDETSHTTKAMMWGTAYEDMAREIYEQLNACTVEIAPSIRHPELECLSCSPDGMIGEEGLIEIKCMQEGNFIKTARQIAQGVEMKKISKQYYWQMQTQLAVTGRKWCDFVVFHPNVAPKIKILRVERDEEAIGQILERATEADKIVKETIKLLIQENF